MFWPGLTSAERHLEVTAMADYVPFLGVEDLREILAAVLHRKATTVKECRPLKVTNYLQVSDVTMILKGLIHKMCPKFSVKKSKHKLNRM